ncbi:MAG: PQQ-dependent sugar dehydrogenase [Acidobacteriota bacterium]
MSSLTRSLATAAALTALALPASAQIPSDLQLTSLGVSVNFPVAVRNADDGSGRLFIVERDGTIEIYHPDTGLAASPFLDITADVDTFFEGGLLGLAFHPDYDTNGYFYVSYTRDGGPLTTVIDRFTVSSGDPDDADESSRVEIFTLPQPFGNHNGGDIHFGPDGHLYIGLGDGGGGGSANSQNNANLLGAMVRIAPCDTATCAQGYTIPADNPFLGVAGMDEIWSSGLRNPYRWSFDRQTGDMFIGDVGQSAVEEISFQAAGTPGGLNFGWDCREGDIAGQGGCSGTFEEPILTYRRPGGNCSVTGGYRYRGCIEGLRGVYVYSDFCSSRVWFATEDTPGNWSSVEWDQLSGSVIGFGEDEDGELYILRSGSIDRFESPTTCVSGQIFESRFEDGTTGEWSSASP